MCSFEIRKVRVLADDRGCLFEPLGGEELAVQRNVHVVVTRPGQVRGNHYHNRATEWLTVLGPARVRVRVATEIIERMVPAGEAWRFTLPPGVVHAIENTGSEPGLAVSFTDQFHDPDRPDTAREVLIPPCP
jgi:dTDP-4-dehydrorhamnose 3,5-epimerase-like enzyme